MEGTNFGYKRVWKGISEHNLENLSGLTGILLSPG